MKIFLSALNSDSANYIISKGVHMKWNLLSYYYIQKQRALGDLVKQHSDEVMIDSGAHSFQFGKKVDWVEYTEAYAQFITEYDSPKVVGFFEMDVDNIIGMENVLYLRRILEKVSDKIIPVWHFNRGINDYKQMCEQYAGKVISITGFANKDIRDDQYIMFLKYAWKHNCKVHCLGMTRKKVLDKVPFDYTDSSSWLQNCVYGQVYNPITRSYQKVSRAVTKTQRLQCYLNNYLGGKEMQEHYYRKWIKYEKQK